MTSNISKGLEKLIEKGELEKAIKVAEKLLKKGDSVGEVVEIAELLMDKIQEIKRNMVND